MRRTVLILCFLLGLGLLGSYKLATLEMKFLDGSFDLTVEVNNSGSQPIRAVSCLVVLNEQEAESVLFSVLEMQGTYEGSTYSATVDPYLGKPFQVRVPSSSRESIFGWELSRSQGRFLVVFFTSQDGKRSGKWLEIPDCRDSTSVTVSFS